MQTATADQYITIAQYTTLVPNGPHLATLHRWTTRGVRGVRLKSVRAGHRVYTTEAWVQEFLAR